MISRFKLSLAAIPALLFTAFLPSSAFAPEYYIDRPIWIYDCPSHETCADGYDNNCNGLVDSNDPECYPIKIDIACFPIEEQCNGLDDDCDGLIDDNVLIEDPTPCNGKDVCLNGTIQPQAGSVPNVDDGNPCTSDSCDPSTGDPVHEMIGECQSGPDCDLAQCTWKTPNCSLSCPGAVVSGADVECNIQHHYGDAAKPPNYECTLTKEGEGSSTVTPSAGKIALNDMNANADLNCFVTIDAKKSDPCSANITVGACGVDCRQSSGVSEVSIGEPASCRLTSATAGYECSYEGQTVSGLHDGSFPVDTKTAGEKKVSVTCSDPMNPSAPTVSCEDALIVNPVCKSISYTLDEGKKEVHVTCETAGASQKTVVEFNGTTRESADPTCQDISFPKPSQPGEYPLKATLSANGSTVASCETKVTIEILGPRLCVCLTKGHFKGDYRKNPRAFCLPDGKEIAIDSCPLLDTQLLANSPKRQNGFDVFKVYADTIQTYIKDPTGENLKNLLTPVVTERFVLTAGDNKIPVPVYELSLPSGTGTAIAQLKLIEEPTQLQSAKGIIRKYLNLPGAEIAAEGTALPPDASVTLVANIDSIQAMGGGRLGCSLVAH